MKIDLNTIIQWENLFIENFEDISQAKLLTERVIHVNIASNELILIDIYHPTALPLLRDYREVESALSTNNAYILAKDPYDFVLRPDNQISESSRKIRDEAWYSFAPLIEKEDVDFDLKP